MLHPLVLQILKNRGFSQPELLQEFLYGTLKSLPNPFLLQNMDHAVDRLIQAMDRKEKILFFGDYDVDGITGTAQMRAFFREIGCPAESLLPLRMEDGYGLTENSIRKIVALKPNLVVTIDNGTTAVREISTLRKHGIDAIIVDHHETPGSEPPPAIAIVNPKAENPGFPDRNIASAGLVFLLLMALRSRLRDHGFSPLPNLKRYLDLASLGTIADIVPMTGTNRLLVKYGLEEIGTTSRMGLKTLLQSANIPTPINVGHVSFRIAPRINAAGRLADPKIALDLLLAETPDEAIRLSHQLEQLNQERQRVEEKVLQEAVRQVEEHQTDRKGLVVAGANWHLGVVGIVAAKLTEIFGRPAVVLSMASDGSEARGSARTIPGFSVYAALKAIEKNMLRFGGHDAAAGMTIAGSNLKNFSEKFDQSVKNLWGNERQPLLRIDAELPLSEVNLALIQDLRLLEPHGPGNPEPVFMTNPVSIQMPRIVGTNHLKMVLCQKDTLCEAIGFQQASYLETALKNQNHRIAFLPQINRWNGTDQIQIKIKNINPDFF